MTPASLTTQTESIGFSTASDYYNKGREPQGAPPHAAVSIIWYDQATPIFACPVHEPHIRSLRHAGDEQVANYDDRRAEAYRRMFEEGVTCDVCAGKVPEKVDR